MVAVVGCEKPVIIPLPSSASIAGGFLLGLALIGMTFIVVRLLASRHWSSTTALVARQVIIGLLVVTGLLMILRFFIPAVLNDIWVLIFCLVPGVLGAMILIPWWLPRVVGKGMSPILGAYTGGDETEIPKPFYARAVAYRKRGHAAEALAEVESQLSRFPGDAQGLMMMSEIMANEMSDVPAALSVLDQLLERPECSPEEAALALQQKSSWDLDRLKDVEAARRSLEQLIERCPGTQAALTARQQMARLPSEAALESRETPRKLVVVHHPERVGLMPESAAPTDPVPPPTPQDDGGEAMRLLQHLEQFPDDWTAREQLADVYERKWNRRDLASDEWEKLIHLTTATPRQTAQWLNLLADLQLRSSNGAGAARLTLERIGQRFPGTPWAEQADSRIRLLGLDQRAKAAPKILRLGTYEQNIGLKRGDPSIPDPSKSVS